MPPLTETERKHLGHSHYILEMAESFMRSGGLYGIMIPFNITDEDLYPLLDQINGVFFTGGDLDLYDPKTGVPHPYTVTG